MSGPTVAVYASGHGFGHAARMAALLEALAQGPGPPPAVHVRSDAPAWLFHETFPEAKVHPVSVDPGILQRNALDVDVPATVHAHRRHLEAWPSLLAAEADWLRACGVELVVSDIAPLACAAAARASIPSFAVSNFGWDWILAPYLGAAGEAGERADATLAAAIERYGEAYARAECLFRLPLHGKFPAFARIVDVPHLVRRSRRAPAETRRRLGVADGDGRPLVLVSFGGFSRDTLAGAAGSGHPLRDFLFAGFGAAPAGLDVDWLALPHPAPVPHPDLVAACDVVMGKAGYSTVAEVLAERTRFLYVPRPDYVESEVLTEGLVRDGCALAIERDAFFAGRWRDPLERLLARPRAPVAPPADGARVVAGAIRERLAA